jgi:hypothetical protein
MEWSGPPRCAASLCAPSDDALPVVKFLDKSDASSARNGILSALAGGGPLVGFE